MDNYARKRLTYILATLTSLSIVAFSHGRPISQVGETRGLHPPGYTQGTDSGEDCLHNQYFSDELQMCQNCTYCYPGTQHSPTVEKCGFSSGHETTCSPCETGYYQPGEGYSDLKCYRCVTCYNAEVLKQCTPTQNAECGDCFPGMYEMAENTCINCTNDPSHPNCIKSIPVHVNDPASGTQPSPNQTSPTHLAPTPHEPTISTDLTLENATGVPPNVTEVNDDKGTSTTKFTWREGVFLAVGVVVICVIFLLGLRYKKCCSGDRASEPSTLSNRKVAFRAVPNGAPDSGEESEQQSPCGSGSQVPSSVVLTPQPAQSTRTPVTASAPLDTGTLQGAGPPMDPLPDPQSLEVTNTEASLPRPLLSNGGPSGDDEVYQQEFKSLAEDDSGDSDLDADDDNDRLSQPGSLMS